MILNTSVLFLSAFLAGFLTLYFPGKKKPSTNFTLVFGGAYLFSITIIHILPETYSSGVLSAQKIGMYVLVGFFIQKVLELFSAGVEHGHLHAHDHDHQHSSTSSVMLLLALSAHAVLEGALLSHPSSIHAHHDANAVLLGIALHKIPAAVALVATLRCYIKKKPVILLYLILFAAASPIGLLVSDLTLRNEQVSKEIITILFAVVSGNFLYISTTIFFESNPEHKFDLKKMLVSLLGVFTAILIEIWL